MPPKLLLLTTDLEIGGTPTVVRELSTRLARRGHIVEVVCLSPWGPVATQIQSAGVRVTALGATSPTSLQILPRLARLIRDHRTTHVLSFLIHANTAAAVAGRFTRHVRYFQSIQTTQPDPSWHWKLQSIAHHAAEKILVPSKSVADVAHRWSHIPREKIVMIPNAIDPADFPRITPPPLSTRPYPIGFIGRLDPIKQIPKLIQQLGLCRSHQLDVHLHIFGQGPDRLRIESEISRLNLSKCVTLHGPTVSPHQALSQIGLLILPSLAEGFGLVLIEAMASGIPVLATDAPGIRDVIQNNHNGLLAHPDMGVGMTLLIRKLIADESLRAQLIADGLTTVVEKYTWDRILPQYESALELE